MIFLTLLSALLLSGIAAYYSVIGLAAIFTGAFWPIVFMGSVLELSKLVTTSWLYRNWKTCPLLLKSYLTFAVVILMIITSMGIFGFLSKAHIDSTMDAGANTLEVKTLVQQEKITKERLDYLLARAKDPSTASNRLDKQIQDTQKELTEINKKKLPLLKENNKLTAEVGPIKYVGDMIYGTEDENGLDKAVRLVIMLIMVVFDPLAVLLLIAANMSMANRSGRPIVKFGEIVGLTPENKDEKSNTTLHKAEVDIPVFTERQASEVENDTIKVEKENIVAIEENLQPKQEEIVIDEASGETIPPITTKGKRGFPVRKSKAEDISKYDEAAELAFKERKELDGGKF
jgi:hypothetical protein